MTVEQHRFANVRKRDGRIVPFDQARITNAVRMAMLAAEEGDPAKDAEVVSDAIIHALEATFPKGSVPTIEEIQDTVEQTLIAKDFAKTVKSYILYRNERAKLRVQRAEVPARIHALAEESKKYFRNALAEFVYYRTYSRWNDDEGRRETWVETVDRFVGYMRTKLGDKLTDAEYAEVQSAILHQEAMPAMRLVWSSGHAVAVNNISAYNCSFVAPARIEDFAEIMYLSMSGAGVGFSVESQTIQQLPIVARQTGKKFQTFVVPDSKEGWCDALKLGMKAWYAGKDISFDLSELRPAGARLKTMGGRSSGPEPLRQVLAYTREKILSRQGKRLKNIDVHDIICKMGEVVVMGGVRRTALISLSDVDDDEMRKAKTGQFFLNEPQRSLANNSAAYNTKPSNIDFLAEWLSLATSGTGERGIFNRGGLIAQLPARRTKLSKKYLGTMGTNPCGEIILRSRQFCNLTEVVARAEDTEETLLRKTRVATILGTYQSMLTDFPYLSKDWKRNCEEERLLGVSITGQWDCPAVRNAETLDKMKAEALRVNAEYAKRFGINPSAAITCVKPSGTVSKFVDAASGMHPRPAAYYIQRIRISATDPLFHMLRDQKFRHYPEVGQTLEDATTFVLEFPVKAPEGAVLKNDLTALQQLEHWKLVKEHFTEHNPSVTVSVGDNEWIDVAHWVYGNWDLVGGLSFLPRDKHVYKLAPWEEITKERYEQMVAAMPPVDFSGIVSYEREDGTSGAKELACVSGTCEIDTTPVEVSAVIPQPAL